MLPLTKVKLQKLWFFGNWNSKAKIVFLLEILGIVIREASLQHFLSQHRLTSWLVFRLKAPRRL
jgi:hypothetical protein